MKKSTYLLITFIVALTAIFTSFFKFINWFYILKPLTTVLILLLPIIFIKLKLSKYALIIILGLCFCLIGDVLLMFEHLFIYGLASFLLGHILFTYAFTTVNGFSYNVKPLVFLILFAIAMFFVLKDNLGQLLIPVILYIICIVIMAWQALNLYFLNSNKVYRLVAVGAILFLISDAVLAYNMFVIKFSFSELIILSTYWAAICFIALSALYIPINK